MLGGPDLPPSDHCQEVKSMKTQVALTSSTIHPAGQPGEQRLSVQYCPSLLHSHSHRAQNVPAPPHASAQRLKNWDRCCTGRWFNLQGSLRNWFWGTESSGSIPQTVVEHLLLAKLRAAGLKGPHLAFVMHPQARPFR